MAARLENKIAIVTGGGSIGPGIGNGKATAILYAREGARVLVVDRDLSAAEETKKIITADGGTCITFQADVRWEKMVMQELKWGQFLYIKNFEGEYKMYKVDDFESTDDEFDVKYRTLYWDIETDFPG